MEAPVLGALLAGLAGALATYLVAARKLSGRIQTTEADKLWEEASKLREDYAKTAQDLRLEITECRERIRVLERDNEQLHTDNGHLINRVEELSRENERLKTQIKELQGA